MISSHLLSTWPVVYTRANAGSASQSLHEPIPRQGRNIFVFVFGGLRKRGINRWGHFHSFNSDVYLRNGVRFSNNFIRVRPLFKVSKDNFRVVYVLCVCVCVCAVIAFNVNVVFCNFSIFGGFWFWSCKKKVQRKTPSCACAFQNHIMHYSVSMTILIFISTCTDDDAFCCDSEKKRRPVYGKLKMDHFKTQIK